jgi:hypothetical protein
MQDLSLFEEVDGDEKNEFLRLQVGIVELYQIHLESNCIFILYYYLLFPVALFCNITIQAIQNEREIEALRKNLTVCHQAKEKLERYITNPTLRFLLLHQLLQS